MRAGLCSVTFRGLPAEDVLALAVDARLDGIEWGGDVHVPPGALEVADRLARRCRDAGVAIPSYGSYLVAGELDQPVSAVLDTAQTLGASTVRVWAGLAGPADADAPTCQRVAGHLASLVSRASARGLDVAVEFHEGTLSETAASTLELFADVADNRLRSYWQPRAGAPVDRSLAELDGLGDRVAHLHVFWWHQDGTRCPLADGTPLWTSAFERTAALGPIGPAGRERFAFLEFVADDDVDAFRRDASTLRRLLGARGDG